HRRALGLPIDAEIKALVNKSAAGKLSQAEDARLNRLYETRVARDEAQGPPRQQPVRAPAGEFDRLIQKSVSGRLSAAEDARLNQLSQARAVEQGLVDTNAISHGGSEGSE